MDLHLGGKVAVVTGASKGIGLAVTQSLVAEGVRVAAGSRSGGKELFDTPGEVLPVNLDLTEPEAPAQLVETAASAFGGIDIVVNNVGAVRPRLGGFLALDDEDWSWALTINLLVAVRTMRAAVPQEFGPRGVRFNTISPGPVETALWLGDEGVAATVSRANGDSAEAIAKQAASGAATGRFTYPQEVADLVLVLASDRAGNTTGSDFVIDGGLVPTL